MESNFKNFKLKKRAFGGKLTEEEIAYIKTQLDKIPPVLNDTTAIGYFAIPEVKYALELKFYIEYGLAPGHFLHSLLTNNILALLSKGADGVKVPVTIHAWIKYMYLYLPEESYGSEGEYGKWATDRWKILQKHNLRIQDVYNYWLTLSEEQIETANTLLTGIKKIEKTETEEI